jgi:spermidine/putrescine transport system ATP-binding protein
MNEVHKKESDKYEIELKHVSKAFKEVIAVDDVDIQIKQGEFFSLLGPSGCGKTTTLRMIAGLESPSSGDILIEHEDVTDVPAYHRDVNTVFQDYAIFPHMNVYENIYYPLRMKKVSRKDAHNRILSVLKLVNMEGFEHRFSNQLSGGQRQRIALARALVNEPKALLLDEPLGALDFKLRIAMQSALKELQTKLSMTFVYVTHDQTEAITMSDRIAVMANGKVHQIGTPDEIYNNPSTAFVASFIGEMNFMEGEVVEKEDDTLVVRTLGSKVVCMRGSYDINPQDMVLICIRPEKLHINAKTKQDNELEPILKRIIFRGNDYEVRAAVNETELRAIMDHQGFKKIGENSKSIRASWDIDDAIVFPIDMKKDLVGY